MQVLHRLCHRLQNLLKPMDKVSPLTVPAMMFSVGDPELRVTFSAVGRGMVWYPQSGLSLIIFHLSPTSLVSAAKRQRGLLPIHTWLWQWTLNKTTREKKNKYEWIWPSYSCLIPFSTTLGRCKFCNKYCLHKKKKKINIDNQSDLFLNWRDGEGLLFS